MSGLRDLIRDTVTENGTARRVGRQSMALPLAEQALSAATAGDSDQGTGVDDGVPPVAPTGVVVTAFKRAVAVSWEMPPPEDYVKTTVIRATPSGLAARETTVRTDDGAAFVDVTLPASGPLPTAVEVKHRDVWGRESAWSAPLSATPDPNTVDFLVADRILTGVLQAAVSITSGGYIAASGARLDTGGMSLTETASELSAPDVDRGSKITPPGVNPFAHFQFFRTGSARGVHLRTDGGGTAATTGLLRFEATGSGNPAGVQALIQAKAGLDLTNAETFVRIKPHLDLQGNLNVLEGAYIGGALDVDGSIDTNAGLDVNGAALFRSSINQAGTPFEVGIGGGLTAAVITSNGSLTFSQVLEQLGTPFDVTAQGVVSAERFVPQYASGSVVIPASQSRTYNHNLGQIPTGLNVLRATGGGNWRWAVGDTQIDVGAITDNEITIINNSIADQTVRITAYR